MMVLMVAATVALVAAVFTLPAGRVACPSHKAEILDFYHELDGERR